MLYLSFENIFEVEHLDDVLTHVALVQLLKSFSRYSRRDVLCPGHRVNILNLDEGLHLVLQHFFEVNLEFTPFEIFDDRFPFGRFCKIA